MSELKLLAIIEAYSITGPAKNLLDFAHRASHEDVATTIVTFTRGGATNQFTETVRAASDKSLTIEVIEERGPFDPQAIRHLKDVVNRAGPDIIQSHALKSHFLVRTSGLGRSHPWVAFHHGYTWPTKKARLYNQLDRWSLRAPAKIVTVSVPFREELESFGVRRDRVEIVHNAIAPGWGNASRESEKASALRESYRIPPNASVILIVGRLSKEKDHITLLDAVSALDSDLSPHVVVVGDGPERERIERHVEALGLTRKVTLTGHQPSAEPWYGIADVAVLSSLSEGSPNALLEAMAAGVPVVSTNVGGVPEIVTDGESALLVPPGDSKSMSEALRKVLSQPDLSRRLTTRSSELIRERHDPDARMRRLVSIYRSLAG